MTIIHTKIFPDSDFFHLIVSLGDNFPGFLFKARNKMKPIMIERIAIDQSLNKFDIDNPKIAMRKIHIG